MPNVTKIRVRRYVLYPRDVISYHPVILRSQLRLLFRVHLFQVKGYVLALNLALGPEPVFGAAPQLKIHCLAKKGSLNWLWMMHLSLGMRKFVMVAPWVWALSVVKCECEVQALWSLLEVQKIVGANVELLTWQSISVLQLKLRDTFFSDFQ